MIDRTEEHLGLKPERLTADTAYGTGKFLAWLIGKGITPHIPVWDMSKREDGCFSRDDFTFDRERNVYTCPAGKLLTTTGKVHADRTIMYIASTRDCRACPLKPKCTPNMRFRRLRRDINGDARDVARALVDTPEFEKSRDERSEKKGGNDQSAPQEAQFFNGIDPSLPFNHQSGCDAQQRCHALV